MAKQIITARARRPFSDVADLCARASVDKHHQDLLAQASALRGLSRHRHYAHWELAGVEKQLPLFGNVSPSEIEVARPKSTQAEDTLADYKRNGLTLGEHPMAQIRERLRAAKCTDSKTLRARRHNSYARVAGMVTLRQRPQTASGVTFLTMEDARLDQRHRLAGCGEFLSTRALGIVAAWRRWPMGNARWRVPLGGQSLARHDIAAWWLGCTVQRFSLKGQAVLGHRR